jgi:hypothetical protein
MAATRIRTEDVVGIGIAVAAHVALFAWLILSRPPEPPPPVKSVTVTLQGPVSAEAGSPSREEAAAAQAPTIAEEPAPPAEAAPAPAPPQVQPQPRQVQPAPPRPATKTLPPPPRPQPRAAPAPVPQRAQPSPSAPPAKAPLPQQRQSRVGSDFLPPRQSRIGKDFLPANPGRPGGASRIGKDFLPGAATGSGKAATPPGPAITPELRVSFAQAVLRQVRPNWQGRVPQGLDAEKLVSIISVQLNRDGSIAGEPILLRQEGINDANSSQARRHGEEAIRAVKLSAPFRLPPEAYEGWKKLPPLRFRKGS